MADTLPPVTQASAHGTLEYNDLGVAGPPQSSSWLREDGCTHRWHPDSTHLPCLRGHVDNTHISEEKACKMSGSNFGVRQEKGGPEWTIQEALNWVACVLCFSGQL